MPILINLRTIDSHLVILTNQLLVFKKHIKTIKMKKFLFIYFKFKNDKFQ
jgi:hypothetical protein